MYSKKTFLYITNKELISSEARKTSNIKKINLKRKIINGNYVTQRYPYHLINVIKIILNTLKYFTI